MFITRLISFSIVTYSTIIDITDDMVIHERQGYDMLLLATEEEKDT